MMSERIAKQYGYETWDDYITVAKELTVDFSVPLYYNTKNQVAIQEFEQVITKIKEVGLVIVFEFDEDSMRLELPIQKDYIVTNKEGD